MDSKWLGWHGDIFDDHASALQSGLFSLDISQWYLTIIVVFDSHDKHNMVQTMSIPLCIHMYMVWVLRLERWGPRLWCDNLVYHRWANPAHFQACVQLRRGWVDHVVPPGGPFNHDLHKRRHQQWHEGFAMQNTRLYVDIGWTHIRDCVMSWRSWKPLCKNHWQGGDESGLGQAVSDVKTPQTTHQNSP